MPPDYREPLRADRELIERLNREYQERVRYSGLTSTGSAVAEPVTNRKKHMKKERHFNQDERLNRHNPETDWEQSPRGERCISAYTLDVSDIVEKYKDPAPA